MKKILNFLLIALSTCLAFLLFNYISLLLPNDNITYNVQRSVNIFKEENLYYLPFTDNKDGVLIGYQYDNYSDAKILLIAYDSPNKIESTLKRAVGIYTCTDNIEPIECLKRTTDKEIMPHNEYSRYWFGTSFLLRYLLIFFDFQEIRYINLILVSIVLFVMLYLLAKETNIKYSFIYLFTFLNVGITIIPFSLMFLPNMLISLIACIILLKNYKKKNFDKYINVFFLLIGLFTTYFDLLSYPLFTFGIPFITWFILYKKDNAINKKTLFKIVLIGLSWLFGYIFANLFKFMIASLVLNKNIFASAFSQIGMRLGNSNSYYKEKGLEAIRCNYVYIFNSVNYLILVIYYLLSAKRIIQNKLFNIELSSLMIMVFIGILPMAWYIILKNHSIIHNFMTYRISAITFLILLLIPCICFKKRNKD